MARSAPRRPSPITLPNCPMDTLWEVDESSPDVEMTHQFQPSPRRSATSSWFASPPSAGPLRSIFEDDDDEEQDDDLCFPLPPRSVPAPKPSTSKRSMTLPIQPVPQQRTPSPTGSFTPSPRSSSLYAPRRAPVSVPFPLQRVPSPSTPAMPPRRQRQEVQRPVSPTSSASSSDTEPPRTPPAASTSLPCAVEKPVRVLPPTEWESAIDALYAFDDSDEDDEQPSFVQPRPSKRSSAVPPMPTRPPPPPPRSSDDDDARSYISWSPVSSPGPLSPSQLPMSPMFGRALNSPGFMPTSPTGSSDHGHSFVRPPRSSRRAVPERTMIPVEMLFSS
ncbi:hypothetical protein RhiLY_09921 [Ceratobasidium sp. AG-Ba]|nr:hypothetical protein RhiLY_09921 [Ceratobasidium sp. AG-Ba]